MIEKLENVTAIAKANVYFDGKVVSHIVYTADGEKKTLGLFMPGDYEFGTDEAEIMDMTVGTAEVLLPGEKEYRKVTAGESFNIPGDAKYKLRCYEIIQYVCSYIPK
jgi:uncharacterized protein YaiE (UPF0345 family)